MKIQDQPGLQNELTSSLYCIASPVSKEKKKVLDCLYCPAIVNDATRVIYKDIQGFICRHGFISFCLHLGGLFHLLGELQD